MSRTADGIPRMLTLVEEERGALMSIDLAACPFRPQRVFTVSAPNAPVRRGGHDSACAEYILLVRGGCTVLLGHDASVAHHLTGSGDGCLIEAGTHVVYELETSDSVVLVLADRPYREEPCD